MQPSRLEIGLAGEGTFRWVAADLTLPLEEARRCLDLSPLASVALGRALVGAVLLQRFSFKVPARLILEVHGDGPLGSVRAEAEHTGKVRGTVGNPRVEGRDGGFRIAGALGEGSLFVTRETTGVRARRYTSQVSLVSGELGDDLTHYLEQSEQIRSAVLLGVLPTATGIGAAGGLIVEALPGTEEDALSSLERNICSLEGVSGHLKTGGVSRLLAATFQGFDLEHLGHHDLEYSCPCDRSRLLGYLRALDREALEDLAEKDGRCEAVCSFCGNRYIYRQAELSGGHAAAC
ncbi:MAG: Hsp33 family molecular chaperone HslO [bacterium]|nr:Hsp33 family molecular chaperone HslO [bacterium]